MNSTARRSAEARLREAFRSLDVSCIRSLLPSSPDCDLARAASAFVALSEGDTDAAGRLLEGPFDDGSISPGDVAYVRAFHRAETGEVEAALALLESGCEDVRASHPARMRLRAAELRIGRGEWQRATAVLEPLLVPPGTEDTLEAHLLLLEVLLRSKAAKERLVEQVALIDALVERGFRLREAENVLAAGQLMGEFRIEGPQERFYAAHGDLIESSIADDPAELAWRVAEGERYKSGALVRSAARAYERSPFVWEGIDPEAVAFQFAQHEEFEAARLTIRRCFAEQEIDERPELWGPLLLCAYHAEHWQETLDLIARHGAKLHGTAREPRMRLLRAMANFHLGNEDAFDAEVSAMGTPAFDATADAFEAACEAKRLNRLGRFDAAIAAARRHLDTAPAEADRCPTYLNAVVNDLLMRRDAYGLDAWIAALPLFLVAGALVPNAVALGELSLSWSMPEGALAAGRLLERLGEPLAAQHLSALAMAGSGRRAEAAEAMARHAESTTGARRAEFLFNRGRVLAQIGRPAPALESLRRALAVRDWPRRHLGWALTARLLDPMDADGAAAARAEAEEYVRERSRRQNPETRQLLEDELANFFADDFPALARERLASVRERAPESSEIPRLERRIADLEAQGVVSRPGIEGSVP